MGDHIFLKYLVRGGPHTLKCMGTKYVVASQPNNDQSEEVAGNVNPPDHDLVYGD